MIHHRFCLENWHAATLICNQLQNSENEHKMIDWNSWFYRNIAKNNTDGTIVTGTWTHQFYCDDRKIFNQLTSNSLPPEYARSGRGFTARSEVFKCVFVRLWSRGWCGHGKGSSLWFVLKVTWRLQSTMRSHLITYNTSYIIGYDAESIDQWKWDTTGMWFTHFK